MSVARKADAWPENIETSDDALAVLRRMVDDGVGQYVPLPPPPDASRIKKLDWLRFAAKLLADEFPQTRDGLFDHCRRSEDADDDGELEPADEEDDVEEVESERDLFDRYMYEMLMIDVVYGAAVDLFGVAAAEQYAAAAEHWPPPEGMPKLLDALRAIRARAAAELEGEKRRHAMMNAGAANAGGSRSHGHAEDSLHSPRPPSAAPRAERVEWAATLCEVLGHGYKRNLETLRDKGLRRRQLLRVLDAERAEGVKTEGTEQLLRRVCEEEERCRQRCEGGDAVVADLFDEAAGLAGAAFAQEWTAVMSVATAREDLDAAQRTWRRMAAVLRAEANAPGEAESRAGDAVLSGDESADKQARAGNGESRRGRRGDIGKDEANPQVLGLLRENPDMNRDEIARRIGCSTGTISNTPAWKAVKRAQKERAKPQVRHLGHAEADDIEQQRETAPEEAGALGELIEEQKRDDIESQRQPRRR